MNEQAGALIRYQLDFRDGCRQTFSVALTDEEKVSGSADWSRLAFEQCAHCPLDASKVERCPLAAALEGPVVALAGRASFEEVDVVIDCRDREVRKRTTLQRALGSLLGAISATSGCPHTRLLKTMAWFHQPFSDTEETLFRVFGTYLLGQYLRERNGLEADWKLDGLRELYRDLRLVNLGISRRLRAAASEDASLNGLVLLDLLAADTLYSLERYEGELDRYFAEFLRQ